MPRPSGIVMTTAAGELLGGDAGDVAAGDQHLAGARRHQPAGDVERGGLAGAVGTEQRDHLAGGDDEIDAVQHLDRVVRRRALPAAPAEWPRSWPLAPEVGVEHRLVVLDVVGRALGDDLPEVEHVDLRTHGHDQRHVVLDHEDRQAAPASCRSRSPNSVVSVSSRPDAGSSSSRTRRTDRECPTQLDEARSSGGELADADVGGVGEAQPIEDQVDLVGRREVGPFGCEQLAAGRGRPRPALPDLAAHEDVLADGHRAEDLEALERAPDPATGALVRAEPRDVGAVEDDAARPWARARHRSC